MILPMIDIHELPIPDWGLNCPKCGAALAGMPQHQCTRCSAPFNIMALLARKRPMPDLDLACPSCHCVLNGLTQERCPECGQPFDLRALLEQEPWIPPFNVVGGSSTGVRMWGFDEPRDHLIPKHTPRLTGRERPLPDLGLLCARCSEPLVGASGNACPSCSTPFDLAALVPSRELVDITFLVSRSVASIACSVLYEDGTPCAPMSAGGTFVPRGSAHLFVPGEYVFDALHALAAATPEPLSSDGRDWICPNCSETVPGTFDFCWKCEQERAPDAVSLPPQLDRICPLCGEALDPDDSDCPDCNPGVRRQPADDLLDDEDGPDPSAGANWICPACHDEVPGDYDTCWNCQAARPPNDAPNEAPDHPSNEPPIR